MTRIPLPDPTLTWPIVMEGVALCAESEGLELAAYQCEASVWTIGRGHTDGVKPGDTCTIEWADITFCEDLTDVTRDVLRLLKVPADEHQLAALVSLAYNIGVPALAGSTVLKRHNAGLYTAAAQAFLMWNKYRPHPGAALLVSEGLTARRHAEAALYLKPVTQLRPPAMPQAVEPQPTLTASPTAAAGVATTAVGAVAAATQASDTIAGFMTSIGHVAEQLGMTPGALLAIGALGVGAVVLYRRYRQRAMGVA